MKIYLTLLFTSLLFVSFSQNDLWSMEPDSVRSHNINIAHENWIFFDEDGTEQSKRELRTCHFDKEGKKKYLIENTLDIIETRDSTVYFYDEKGREILRRKHIEINPRNLDVDLSQWSSLDTLEEWRTVYLKRKILKISHQQDTFTIRTTRSGRILTESNNYQFTRYYYNGRGHLVKKKEIPSMHVWGKGGGYEPMDTIITIYNKKGNPVSEIGSQREVEYRYENDLLRLKWVTSYESGEKRTIVTKYEYNTKGQMISEKYKVNGEARGWNKYEYDSSGILIRDTSLDPNTGNIELIVETIYE